MWKPNRKCRNYGHVGNLLTTKNSRLSGHEAISAIIQAHANWMMDFIIEGWDAYLFSIMFNHLGGSRQAKIAQMHQETEELYSRLAKRMIRKPLSRTRAAFLPIGLFAPDSPVPKSRMDQKSSISDVSINDGLHMHGIVLGNKWGRLSEGLDSHFAVEQHQYLTNKIRHVDVKPIFHHGAYTIEYALKNLKRTGNYDDILILNWGKSESARELTLSRWIDPWEHVPGVSQIQSPFPNKPDKIALGMTFVCLALGCFLTYAAR